MIKTTNLQLLLWDFITCKIDLLVLKWLFLLPGSNHMEGTPKRIKYSQLSLNNLSLKWPLLLQGVSVQFANNRFVCSVDITLPS